MFELKSTSEMKIGTKGVSGRAIIRPTNHNPSRWEFDLKRDFPDHVVSADSDAKSVHLASAVISKDAIGYKIQMWYWVSDGRKIPFYIASSSTGPVGVYTQDARSPYNLEVGQNTVEIVAAVESIGIEPPSFLDRLEKIYPICKSCESFKGFRSSVSVKCAKSKSACKCVSLTNGTCVKWPA